MGAPSSTGWFRKLVSAHRLAPDPVMARDQWLEVILIPLIGIAVGWWISAEDPMLSQSHFPWLWFAPVLIALRYGVSPGLLSSIPLIINWLVASALGRVEDAFAFRFFFGAGVLVMVCGEFSDVWRDRNARMEETYLYVTERLSRLTKRHLLLNLSHDRLEQEMLIRPGSLRDALARLRSMAMQPAPHDEPMPAANSLLQLLSQYVNLESATLYAVRDPDTAPQLGPALAVIGDPLPLLPGNVLFEKALETRALVHIAGEDISTSDPDSPLIVAPLVAGNDTILGVLVVTRIPFFSLTVENLQMMSVILAYYADNVRIGPDTHKVQQALTGMPAQFAEELVRMNRLHHSVGLSSHVVIMTFEGALGPEITAEFVRVKRGLDLYWQTQIRGLPAVVVLMPFASDSAMEGFIQRIDDWLQQRFHGNIQSLQVRLHTIDFALEDPVQALTTQLAP
ncbi:PelD GGDEF domain-containing protein [Rhodoferax sp.]|uniref:PelD GGDEF domain-containing protein n=1 Tax=Rhodoferax sp. TaxID=50421 RepID=UPI0025F9A37E|nr:PelD GGDEF domain-containing protein [Rhodoferax sp.]